MNLLLNMYTRETDFAFATVYILGLFFLCFVFSLYEYIGFCIFSQKMAWVSSPYFPISFNIATFKIKTGVYERH
jgi:hypothetical protein